MNDTTVSMWVVYDHPPNMPNTFVAVKWVVLGGRTVPTDDMIVSPNLMALREVLAIKGLICLARDPTDDPTVVDVWL